MAFRLLFHVFAGTHMLGIAETQNCSSFFCAVGMELEDLQVGGPNRDTGDRAAIKRNMY